MNYGSLDTAPLIRYLFLYHHSRTLMLRLTDRMSLAVSCIDKICHYPNNGTENVVSLSILLYSGLSSKYFVLNVTEKEGYQIEGRIRK